MRELLSPMAPIPTAMEPALNPLPHVKAVLFDIYGTLLVSGSGDVGTSQAMDNRTALREALQSCGCRGDLEQAADRGLRLLFEVIREEHLSTQAYGRRFPEVEIRDIWTKVCLRLDMEGLLDHLEPDTVERLTIEYECRANPVWPMPGMVDVLAGLRGADYPLGIVSNAQFYTPLLFDALLEQDLESLGFHLPLCSFSWRMRQAKPALAAFAPVVAELGERGISTHEAVFVGNDMLNDIWTAAQSGLRTVLFAGDRRSLRLREDDPRCAHTSPTAVITDLRQLHRLLDPSAPLAP